MDFKFNFGASDDSPDTQHHNNPEENLPRRCQRHTLPHSDSLDLKHFNKMCVGSTILYYMKPDITEEQLKSNSIFPLLQCSDLKSGEYEGGLKLWECTADLLNYLRVKNYPFHEKHVLDLGCGAGLLGLYSYMNGASNVCLQDYNSEVIENLTILSVECTLQMQNTNSTSKNSQTSTNSEKHFENSSIIAINGDISNVLHLNDGKGKNILKTNEENILKTNEENKTRQVNNENKDITASINKFDFLSGDWDNVSSYLTNNNHNNFNLILSSETIYNVEYYSKLRRILLDHLSDEGIALFAAKKHYFGVGGGTYNFMEYLRKDDGEFDVCVVETVDSCLIREIIQVKKIR